MKNIFDKLRRGGWIEHHACLLAERADFRQHPMQMDCRARLGLHQQMIGAGIGEGGEIALRLDYHQMNVERLCRRAAIACSTTGPMVMLGTKRPSITSTWIQSAAAVSTARTSSPNRAKSADRTEGAMMIDGILA